MYEIIIYVFSTFQHAYGEKFEDSYLVILHILHIFWGWDQRKILSSENKPPLLMVSSTATFNCSDHIAELGNTTPVKPMLFMKPPSTYIKNGTAIEVSK